MDVKFNEFYFENEIRPANDYWQLYNKDPKAAIKKYDGHIFCPICESAPLTIVKGNKRRYFKVSHSDMEKHSEDCSFRNDPATKEETTNFYKDLDTTDIESRLLSCLNKMLKKELITTDKEPSPVPSKKNNKNNFLDIKINNRKKYLPNKYLYSENLYKDSDIQTIYYGKCALYIISPNNTNDTNNTNNTNDTNDPNDTNDTNDANNTNNKNNQKYYYLKVLNSYTKKEICEISITKNIYGYLSSDLENIPNKKDEAIDYYICFSGFLKKKQRQYKDNNYDFHQCNLRDSRLLILEKA